LVSRVIYVERMITAVHNLVYSDDPEATRAFFRDVLGWLNFDAGGGWLIFKAGPCELGVHPSSGDHDGEKWVAAQRHEISLVCDDIESTVRELKAKGATFARDVRNDGFGMTTSLVVPGAGEMLLYEAKHPTAYGL
jgi:predicted enzyme related to lactoylglutathione lyase